MPQIILNIKDDLQVLLLLSCFVGHPVSMSLIIKNNRMFPKRMEIFENSLFLSCLQWQEKIMMVSVGVCTNFPPSTMVED